MKKIFIACGISLFVINTLIGLIISDYSIFNLLFSDMSILLSTYIYYKTYDSLIDDGFKIGYTLFFVFTGLIRFICSVLSPEKLKDNIALLLFLFLLLTEVLLIFIGSKLRNK